MNGISCISLQTNLVKMARRLIIMTILASVLLGGCNKNIEPPVITLDRERYTVKEGHELTITPEIANGENAEVTWLLNGKVLGTGKVFTYVWEESGTYYPVVTAKNPGGSDSKEFIVEVAQVLAPVISIMVPEGGFITEKDRDITIEPVYYNIGEDTEIEWTYDSRTVSTDRSYTFRSDRTGTHKLKVTARSEDGEDSEEISIEVVDKLPCSVSFESISYLNASTDRYTFPGRKVILKAYPDGFTPDSFSWKIAGETVEGLGSTISFTPENPGDYTVSVTASDSDGRRAEASAKIVCVNSSEEEMMRTGGTEKYAYDVYEYIPAPGQFIGDATYGGMEEEILTHDQAVQWAEKRLEGTVPVSLGGFGGYIIAGFDHSVTASSEGYDFAVISNAFETSNEPGAVWVMQDVNGNSLPDDEWYMLKGSEYGKPETKEDYSVTYYRPGGLRTEVLWTDSEGNSGTIDYLPAYHGQDTYFPKWIGASTYTLKGTCLAPRNSSDPNGTIWTNAPYGWGYADNFGSDNMAPVTKTDDEHNGQRTGFKISNAIHRDGTPANLKYIDFVKIQTAVNAKSGWTGELSTEVAGIEDL